MIAPTPGAVADHVTALLDPLDVAVYPPPVPLVPVAAPCVLLQLPELVEQQPTAPGCAALYEWRQQLLIIGADTAGAGLLDEIAHTLTLMHGGGYTAVELRAATYDPPDVPAPLPAALLTVE